MKVSRVYSLRKKEEEKYTTLNKNDCIAVWIFTAFSLYHFLFQKGNQTHIPTKLCDDDDDGSDCCGESEMVSLMTKAVMMMMIIYDIIITTLLFSTMFSVYKV